MRRTSKPSVWIGLVLVSLVLFVAAACTKETVKEVPVEVVVEKEVVKEVQVPGETIIVEKEVVKEVQVPGETIIVEKEVVKEVQVPGETIIVEKEVVKEVKVAGETIIVEKEVIIEVPAPAKEKVLRIMTRQTWVNFNPFVGITGTQEQIMVFLYSSLLQANPMKGDWSPNLAERWEIAEDGSSYTFYIRKNAVFHDGEPVTARDVAFTFKTHLIPETGSSISARFNKIKGAQDFLDGKTDDVPGIVVVDDHTIRFDMEEPTGLFLISVWKDIILPEHLLGDVPPSELKTNPYFLDPVGSGPFKFVKYVPDQVVEVEANPDYYFGRPKLDSIQVVSYRSMDALQIAMQRQELEWQLYGKFSNEALQSFINDPRFNLVGTPGGGWWLYNFQSKHDDLRNPKFRQAWYMAIDRQTHIEVFENGNGSILNTPIAMHSWFQKPEYAEMYPFDPERSRELLAEIGWDSSREVEVLTVAVDYLYDWMAVHQQWLADVGIKMVPVLVDDVAYDSRFFSGDFEVSFIADGADPDPDLWLSRTLKTGSNAITGYGDEAFDALILAGRVTNKAERIPVYQEISEQLLNDLPYLPMYIPNNWYVVSKKFVWPIFEAPWADGLPDASSFATIPIAPSFMAGDSTKWHVEEWDLIQ